MLRKFLVLAIAVTFVGTAAISAADRVAHFAAAIHSTDNEYWNQEAEGVKLFAKSLPAGAADVQVLTCDSDDEKQINGIKAFIASHGQDALIYVDPSNAPNTALIAEICEEAGVYWTSVWHLAEGLNPKDYKYYVMHQSVDCIKQGYDIAVEMFKQFKTPGKGKILVLQGLLGNDSAVDRYAGLMQALEEYPDVEMLEMQVCDFVAQRAMNTTETWLAKYNDNFDGIWSANDSMAIGAIQALKGKGLNGKIKVVGIDGVSAAIEAVENGDMVCTIANNGFLQGGYGAAYLYAAWTGKIVPSELPDRQRGFYTEGFMVNKETLPTYRRDFLQEEPKYDFNDLEFPVTRPFVFKD